jgi:hypothetical protein
VENPLNQAMQSTLAVLTKVGPDDLDAPTPCASFVADAAALKGLLLHDATLEATPLRTWFAGRKTCVPFFAVCFNRAVDGAYQPYGVVVLSVTGEGIRSVRSFGDRRLVALFGFRPDALRQPG